MVSPSLLALAIPILSPVLFMHVGHPTFPLLKLNMRVAKQHNHPAITYEVVWLHKSMSHTYLLSYH